MNYKKSQENLEEKVKERTKALEQSNKELKQFAYIASHDLKEPLRMITSFLQLLERRYTDKLDQDANEFIGFAVEGAKRLNEINNDLLEFSKVTRKKIDCSKVDINKVLEQTKMNLKYAIDTENAKINYNILPTIYGDEILIELLFRNIISNAIKYHSNETPKIDIMDTKQLNQHLFAIKDNGIGMSPEHLERIFTIFQRLHTKDEYGEE